MSLNNQLPTVKKTEVLHDEYVRLQKDLLTIPGQADYHYYTLTAAPVAVMILAQTSDGRFVLNWEYRHPVKKTILSCPGGVLDHGETPLSCAERELLEETGYRAEGFTVMGEAYPFPGICTQKTVYVRAKNAVDTGSQALEHAEFIMETALFTSEELKKIVRETTVDGLLLSALCFAWLG